MDIISQNIVDARLLDAVARAALGNATCGVSTGADSRIHLLSKNLPEQQRVSDGLKRAGTLRLRSSATSLRAGDADPVIACRDARIGGDARLGYLALRAGEEHMRGELNVANGECSLTLTQPTAAPYTVFLYRLRGDYASGAIEIRVDGA